MVQLSFLIESSFIALTSIVVGTALGLVVAYNVDQRLEAHAELGEHGRSSCRGLTLGVIFLVVYAVALATTLRAGAPRRRASTRPKRSATSKRSRGSSASCNSDIATNETASHGVRPRTPSCSLRASGTSSASNEPRHRSGGEPEPHG